MAAAKSAIFADVLRWLHKATQRSRRLHHIFKGEVRRDGDGEWAAQGLHHRYLGHDMPDRRVGPIIDEGPFGTYTALVSMRGPGGTWIEKRGVTTFFPDHWQPRHVVAAIDDAFAHSTVVPGTNGRRWSGVSRGLPIEGSYDRRGNWDSGWPIVQW